jgi:hypothetical protein
MDQRQKLRASAEWCGQPPVSGPWTLCRVDAISTTRLNRWPVGRVELFHETRGRVFEVATGAGCLDAAFNAVAALIGVTAPAKSLEVQYEPGCEGTAALPAVTVEIEVTTDGGTYRGCARTGDLLLSAVGAYLDALWRAAEERQARARGAPY